MVKKNFLCGDYTQMNKYLKAPICLNMLANIFKTRTLKKWLNIILMWARITFMIYVKMINHHLSMPASMETKADL